MNLSRRLVIPALIGTIATVVYGFLNFFGYNKITIDINPFYGEQFFAVLSTLYAIITALILVKGIESFDALGGAINREAMKIRSINAYFAYFELSEQVDRGLNILEIRKRLLAYLSNVLDQDTACKSSKNDNIIDECVRYCAGIVAADENDRIAIREIMKGLDELRGLRAERVNCAMARIPGYLIGMLALMTISIMVPFYLENTNTWSFNYYIVFVLGTFGSFIYFLLTDINKPYEGLWKIDLSPFEEARAEISKSCHGEMAEFKALSA